MQKETYVAPELQKQEPLQDITAYTLDESGKNAYN